nr:PREDICTED: uncharacterized protein LOC109438418 isoform X2 [Rhinolophus sinicus]
MLRRGSVTNAHASCLVELKAELGMDGRWPLEGDHPRESDDGAAGGKEPTGGAGRPIPATLLLDTAPHGRSGALLWASPGPPAPALPSAPLPSVPATALCHLCGEPGKHFTGASYATWGSGERCRRRAGTVFFHEVNLLPEDDCDLYICDIFPAHVSVAVDVQLQQEEDFLLVQQQAQPVGTLATLPTRSHHHPEFLLSSTGI